MKTLTEVCKIVGLSRRMIQEYESGDNAIAVTPTTKNKYGYLLYNEEEIKHLMTIKFYREAGYSKKQIKEIFDNPAITSEQILQEALKKLEEKKKELDDTIEIAKGMLNFNVTPNEMFKFFNLDYSYLFRKRELSFMYKAIFSEKKIMSDIALTENSNILIIDSARKLKDFMDNSIDSHSDSVQYYINKLRQATYPLISDSINILFRMGEFFTIANENEPIEIKKFFTYIGEAIIYYCSIHKNDSIFDQTFLQVTDNFFEIISTKDHEKSQLAIQAVYDCFKQLGIFSDPASVLLSLCDLSLEEFYYKYEDILNDTDLDILSELIEFMNNEIYLFHNNIQNNY